MADLSRALEIHVLYASVVWLAAWLVTSMRSPSASAKYRIWVATSLNFALPAGVLASRMRVPRVTPLDVIRTAATIPVTRVVAIVWMAGAIVMLIRLAIRAKDDRGIDGPCVRGLLRPRVVLPDGIERLLTRDELDAVLIHERTHAVRRDNLIRLVHETALCFLWFHPLVRMTGRRLALYRELSCDEAVTRRGLGDELVSALAKLAAPENDPLLRATATSFIGHRLDRLMSPRRASAIVTAICAIVFAGVLLASAGGSVALSKETATCRPPEVSETALVRTLWR